MKILLVEDELFLANLTMKQFKQQNISIENEYDGNVALERIESEFFDVIILDIMLPGLDGYSILKEARASGVETPIIMTSAKSSVADKIKALDLGADDYLTKPYDTFELYARIKTNVRRANSVITEINSVIGDITYDRNTLSLSNNETTLKLTLTEFNLFEYLVTSNGMPISKEQIIDRIWGYDEDISDNQVEVYISYLRKKLKLLSENVSIKTQRQVGYYIEVNNV
ncbi:response regulator transcription factor [Mollicutes bacterium LVI A0078]|nr:response regulator transcription factor [Mollicutes bacterium LVI A0075]WOO91859.1 response regulator transcription factor [Mollicutes bacterium LVI A0078]